jgi:hypothetical protein
MRLKPEGDARPASSHKLKTGQIRIPLSQQVLAGLDLNARLHDPAFVADRTRLVPLAEMPHGDERLSAMAEMIKEADGGSLRTFSGNRTHENGWWPSLKRRRLQHWEGSTQRYALLAAECDFTVEWAQTEPCLLSFTLGDHLFDWYADLWVSRFDGPDEIWEIKSGERQLEKPGYRLKMAGAHEVLRRIGIRHRIVMADEIVLNRFHRDNLELFASRRFVTIPPEHMRRFEAFAIGNGPESTYGELANAIDRACPARGAAILQGLVVRRRVEIDLTDMLTNRTPVRIH